ncbi:hypothetical protein [Blastococcus sp. CT_GayMR16]|uniref:hypothetical protein n=1 Tax=Blastococcus sp. CT_GayMR16 TaxID=2559607 RepID=UPI001073306F|nr:hypothetical protein [Blastococcus sp. CT_GayMR16]TFV83131.1 hypothetical protein E4P38_20975 [Blastococcus sp. CT_GayMR16]
MRTPTPPHASLSRAEAQEVVRLFAAGVQDPSIALLCASALCVQREQRRELTRRRHYRPREHGSDRGYYQHRYDGTPPCRSCRIAHGREARDRRSA